MAEKSCLGEAMRQDSVRPNSVETHFPGSGMQQIPATPTSSPSDDFNDLSLQSVPWEDEEEALEKSTLPVSSESDSEHSDVSQSTPIPDALYEAVFAPVTPLIEWVKNNKSACDDRHQHYLFYFDNEKSLLRKKISDVVQCFPEYENYNEQEKRAFLKKIAAEHGLRQFLNTAYTFFVETPKTLEYEWVAEILSPINQAIVNVRICNNPQYLAFLNVLKQLRWVLVDEIERQITACYAQASVIAEAERIEAQDENYTPLTPRKDQYRASSVPRIPQEVLAVYQDIQNSYIRRCAEETLKMTTVLLSNQGDRAKRKALHRYEKRCKNLAEGQPLWKAIVTVVLVGLLTVISAAIGALVGAAIGVASTGGGNPIVAILSAGAGAMKAGTMGMYVGMGVFGSASLFGATYWATRRPKPMRQPQNCNALEGVVQEAKTVLGASRG